MLHSLKPLLPKKRELTLSFVAFLSLILCFFPIISNFIWGNHDWLALKNDGNLTAGFVEGRITQYLFLVLFLDSHILPLLNTILGFIFYSFTIVLLSSRFFEFDINKKSTPFIIILIATLPYITEIIYFQFIILSQLIWTFTIFISLMFAKKSYHQNYLLNTTLCSLFLFLSIGGYPASSNLFVTATILYLFQSYQQTSNLKQTIQKSIPFAISLIISFISIYFIYKHLQNQNLMIKLYNNETVSLLELFKKIPSTILVSLKSMLLLQPFFSLTNKLLCTTIFLTFIILVLLKQRSIKDYIITLIFINLILLGIKFSALLANQTADSYFYENDPISYTIRTDFYSIPVFMLFAIFYILKSQKLALTNLLTTISFFLIILNINTNLYYSKVQILGFKAELNLLERITTRIKNSPQYSPNTLYTLVQAHELSLRPRFYQSSPLEKYGLYTLKTPFTRYWIPNDHYNFYEDHIFVSGSSSINPKEISPQMIHFLSNSIEVWPSKNSIYIDNKYIIFAQSPKGKSMMKKQFSKLKGLLR